MRARRENGAVDFLDLLAPNEEREREKKRGGHATVHRF